eukprot:2948696-Prymnesium_polylepis.1
MDIWAASSDVNTSRRGLRKSCELKGVTVRNRQSGHFVDKKYFGGHKWTARAARGALCSVVCLTLKGK